MDILDRTGEGCDTSSYSSYYKRTMGLVGTYREETSLEATFGHAARAARFRHRFQISVS